MSLPLLGHLYLAMNSLLIATYSLFWLSSRAVAYVGLRTSHRHRLRIGQILIFLSLLSPFAVKAIPKQNLPRPDWGFFQPADEGPLWLAAKRSKASLTVPKTSATTPQATASSAKMAIPFADLIALFFRLGFTIFGIRFLRNFFKIKALITQSTPIRSLGKVTIAISETTTVPFSARLQRSWVILPIQIVGSSNDFRLAIRHELQHHRQGDTMWALAIEALVCAFFANPAIYLWKKELTELQEFSCDEALLGRSGVSPHEYGSCLVRVAETAFGSRQVHAGTAGMAAVSKNPFYLKSFLRRRIEMLKMFDGSRTRPWAGILLGTTAVAFTVALAFGADQAMRSDEEPGQVNPGVAAVDPAIQAIAETAIRDAIQAYDAKAAFAIVTDPNSGRVLAIANIDTTRRQTGQWSLGQVSEPNTFTKTLVVARAIDKGLTRPEESIPCENGNYRYRSRVYHDHKRDGWDHLTTTETIALSSDICSIKIGERLGDSDLQEMLVEFGFGPEGSAKSFPGARAGALISPRSPLWPDTVPAITAGYGFRASPLELLQAYGAIANGGNLLTPKEANNDSTPQIVRRIFSAETAAQVREILQQVVLKGTARGRATSKLYSTAGKTATSYFPDLTKWELVAREKKGNFAGFIGFAPVKNPRVEVYVGINDPKADQVGGAHGAMHASPVFKRIVEEVLQHLNVAPDKPEP